MTTSEKHCSRCNSIKASSEFYKNKRTRTGLSSYCKDCTINYAASYKTRNSSKYRKSRVLVGNCKDEVISLSDLSKQINVATDALRKIAYNFEIFIPPNVHAMRLDIGKDVADKLRDIVLSKKVKVAQSDTYIAKSAHSAVSKALKSGELKRPEFCELCEGNQLKHVVFWRRSTDVVIVAHHWKGHEYPLDVWWLCRLCNNLLNDKHDGSMTKEQAKDYVLSRRSKYQIPDGIRAKLETLSSYRHLIFIKTNDTYRVSECTNISKTLIDTYEKCDCPDDFDLFHAIDIEDFKKPGSSLIKVCDMLGLKVTTHKNLDLGRLSDGQLKYIKSVSRYDAVLDKLV